MQDKTQKWSIPLHISCQSSRKKQILTSHLHMLYIMIMPLTYMPYYAIMPYILIMPSDIYTNWACTIPVTSQHVHKSLLCPHVNSLVKSCNWQLRKIGFLRKYLTTEPVEKAIHVFISSRLDNGNSLLYGLPDYQLERLQRIQNTAARILTRTAKCSHITPILKDLNWLPIPKRIIFKILTLTFRCLNGNAPTYLSDLLEHHTTARHLRSTNKSLLKVPKSNKKTYGDRAFANAAPRLWNSLPRTLRQCSTLSSFKSDLKTHLYRQSYL